MLIDSPANPIIKTLRSLEQAKHRKASRQFLVEGVRLVEDGLRAGYWPDICLYNPDLLTRTERGQRLLSRLNEKTNKRGAIPIEATERALEAASGTQHPQGIVAAFALLDWPALHSRLDALPLYVICDNIQDPGNLGTLLRTAEAAGVEAAWVSPGSVDPYNPKVVRAAMGAHFRLPLYHRDWTEIALALQDAGVASERVFATAASSNITYDKVDWTGPSALIISNEAHGLSADAAGLTNQVLSIPMHGDTESLNAATAAAVILFEAARQRRTAKGG